MLFRTLVRVVVTVATLLGPLAAGAQPTLNGVVKTAPYAPLPAPAIGLPLLAVLVVLLSAGGAYVLRLRRSRTVTRFAIVAALAGLAGLAFATDGMGHIYTVTGSECGTITVFAFDLTMLNSLQSNCPNPIQIIALESDCPAPDPPSECRLGQILTNGQECTLPECVPG